MTRRWVEVLTIYVPVHVLPVGTRMEAPSQPASCLAAFQQEFEYVCRTLRRLGVRPADIEDMAHEVYLVLNRRWGEYDQTRGLRPWLFAIVLGVATAQKRRHAREFPGTDAQLEVEDPAPHPEQALQVRQARALVVSALDRVPVKRRAVLVMHEIDQVPMRDVASALGIPVFTAYSRLRKAKVEFRAAAEAIRKNGGST
jgi:RNA polymerase sigma-70 factor (ECF subfamily)